jgi:phage/plasmid-associated DNA primase
MNRRRLTKINTVEEMQCWLCSERTAIGSCKQCKAPVCNICSVEGHCPECLRRLTDGGVEGLIDPAPYLDERPPLDFINVRNGIFDIKTEKLLPHTSGIPQRFQLPIDYDPNARCPAWEKFMAEILPPVGKPGWEVMAWLLTGADPIRKMLCVTGDPNNRRRFLTVLVSFLGVNNVASRSLHELATVKHAPAERYLKLANIYVDPISDKPLESTSLIRSIVEHREIIAYPRGQSSFRFTPWAKLVFSCDRLPETSDSLGGLNDLIFPLELGIGSVQGARTRWKD